MTVDYSRVPSPSSCVPLPSLRGLGEGGVAPLQHFLLCHITNGEWESFGPLKIFCYRLVFSLQFRLFTAIEDFHIFSQILFAYLAIEAQAKYCVMTFSASPSQGASVQPQWFRVPPHSWLTITSRFFKYRVTKKRQIKNLRRWNNQQIIHLTDVKYGIKRFEYPSSFWVQYVKTKSGDFLALKMQQWDYLVIH